MFVSSNLLRDLLPYFKRKLKSIYDENETENIFFLICDYTFGLSKIQVLHDDKRLTESELLFFRDCVNRLSKNEPVQYILGETEFYGLPFKVTPDVLIPRPETEELVDLIIRENKNNPGIEILDVGCGSGCIPVTLKKFLNESEVTAVDVSESAIQIARSNAGLNSVEVKFLREDFFSDSVFELTDFDIIVSNPPYIAESERISMHANVVDYEPSLALFVPDTDPLKFYLRILNFAQKKLKSGGLIYFEINPIYADRLKEISLDMKFSSAQICKDISGKNRYLKIAK